MKSCNCNCFGLLLKYGRRKVINDNDPMMVTQKDLNIFPLSSAWQILLLILYLYIKSLGILQHWEQFTKLFLSRDARGCKKNSRSHLLGQYFRMLYNFLPHLFKLRFLMVIWINWVSSNQFQTQVTFSDSYSSMSKVNWVKTWVCSGLTRIPLTRLNKSHLNHSNQKPYLECRVWRRHRSHCSVYRILWQITYLLD